MTTTNLTAAYRVTFTFDGERHAHEFTFRAEAIEFARIVSAACPTFRGWRLDHLTDAGRWSRVKLPLLGGSTERVRFRVIDADGEELAVASVYPTGWNLLVIDVGRSRDYSVPSMAVGLRAVLAQLPAGRIVACSGDRL